MANNVSVGLNVSDAAKELFLKMLETNPEQLKALLEQVGRKDVEKIFADTRQAVVVAQEKDALNKFKADLSKDLIDFGNSLHDSGEILAGIDRAEIRLYFTRSEYTLGTQVLQPGFHVIRFDAKTDMMANMENLSKIAKSTPGGGKGNGKSVPIPPSLVSEGINKWTQLLARDHKERYDELTAKKIAYSAPRELEVLKDPHYLAAKAAWHENLIPGAVTAEEEEVVEPAIVEEKVVKKVKK